MILSTVATTRKLQQQSSEAEHRTQGPSENEQHANRNVTDIHILRRLGVNVV
jgi:hypothetical protein